jgi:hypothetical protein
MAAVLTEGSKTGKITWAKMACEKAAIPAVRWNQVDFMMNRT